MYPNDDVYEGDFVEGIREGKGSYTFNKIFKYQGEWQDNVFSGKGKLYKHGIIFFDGSFLKGLKHGYGTYIY